MEPQATEPLPVCQFSGDLLCPICGAEIDVRVERTEDGWETQGHCAECVTVVEIVL